jgi:hypothetical protein
LEQEDIKKKGKARQGRDMAGIKRTMRKQDVLCNDIYKRGGGSSPMQTVYSGIRNLLFFVNEASTGMKLFEQKG